MTTIANREPKLFTIGVDDQGRHTAFREVEPVFCFIRESEAEAVRAATETIEDYAKRFLRRPAGNGGAAELRLSRITHTREMSAH